MGKASKWFKALLGFKKPDPSNNPSQKPHSKRRWSFALSHRGKDRRRSQDAVAAVVRLTAGGGNTTHAGGGFNSVAHVTRNAAGYWGREESAAVMIQSHFRAYLSRRALRALKALVMLQALVRGQILRKHYVRRLRQMLTKRTPQMQRKSSRSNSYNVTYDHEASPLIRLARSWEQDDKILEVDTWKPRHNHIFRTPQSSIQYFQRFPVSGEIRPLSHLKFDDNENENDFTTAENSPQYYSASSMGGSSSSRRTPFHTPAKSDNSSGYSDYPSYMAYTESSKAKLRSLSAPKQRPMYERSSSTMNRYSVHVYGNMQKGSALHANFTNKFYPGSGRLDRLGMPVRGDISGFSGGHWHRK
ncbi:hypothetical protein ACS0TY_022142 [Phlomoides rotata]